MYFAGSIQFNKYKNIWYFERENLKLLFSLTTFHFFDFPGGRPESFRKIEKGIYIYTRQTQKNNRNLIQKCMKDISKLNVHNETPKSLWTDMSWNDKAFIGKLQRPWGFKRIVNGKNQFGWKA